MDNDESNIPRLVSRVCSPPPSYEEVMKGETPLNLSIAVYFEEIYWPESVRPPHHLIDALPAVYESSDSEDNCRTQ